MKRPAFFILILSILFFSCSDNTWVSIPGMGCKQMDYIKKYQNIFHARGRRECSKIEKGFTGNAKCRGDSIVVECR